MNIELLKEIIATPSPSGYEDNLQKLLVKKYKEADAFIDDNQGSLAVVYNENANFKVALMAHADEISLVVNGYNNDGTLTVCKNGGIRTKLYVGTKVRIITKNGILNAVVGTNSKVDEKAKVDVEDLFIDLGLNTKEEAERIVPLGSYIIHDTDLVELQNGYLAARAFDDRLGVYVIQEAALKAKKMGSNVGIYAIATTGEETTGRGAYSSSSIIKPDLTIIVDVTFANDYIGADMPGDVKVGKGGVICLGSLPNRKLNDLLEMCAKKLNYNVQYEVFSGRTGTDGDTILKTNDSKPQVLFSIPLRYMHSPVEVANIKDIESMIDILALFLNTINKEYNLKPYDIKENS